MQKIFNGVIRNVNWYRVLTFFMVHSIAYLSICQEIDTDHNKIRTVVIDAGHGGKDSGAVGAVSKEKDIALTISLLAGQYIEEKIPGTNVIYTRKTDVFVPLHERAKIANDNNADLFISVHVNSNQKSTPYGTSTHVLGLHRMEENFEVAKRENSVILLEEDYEARYEDFDPNSPESYIMFSLMQDVYFDQSIYFGQMVQDQFRDRAKRKDRGVKQQGLLVLAQTSMPGVLVETGFISNVDEEKYLLSTEGQEYLASAIYRAFKKYKNHIEGVSSTETPVVAETKPSSEPSSVPETVEVKETSKKEVVATNATKDADDNAKESDNSIEFKVQVLYSNSRIALNDEAFKDFNDVQEIDANGNFKYVVGKKSSYTEAVEYSKWVKNRFPDAFVVAVSNGKIIPLSEVQ